MKIDIQDIKFWMDAIRNSEDRDRTLESFWGGQLKSKTWLIDVLEKHYHISNVEIVIHGGWNGVLASLLFNSTIGIKHITSIDMDPSCEKIASTINKRQEIAGKFKAITGDMCDYDYTGTNPYYIINTSCEHITTEQYSRWIENIPEGCKIVLQSNDYSDLEEHINCHNSLQDFEKWAKIKVEHAEELQLEKYKRFLLIGTV